MSKLLEKFIAVLLVFTLAGANFGMLGMYTISYALSDSDLAGQETKTENSNVEFNAYFEGGGHSKTEDLNSKEAKLYANVKVKNAGYLKNGVISFEDVNFKIGDIQNDNVQSIDKENNKIVLKQLNNGSDVTIEIPISILNDEEVALDNFSKETKASFSGIYIDGNGKEKSVKNQIVNKLSWNGVAEAEMSAELTKYVPYKIDENYGVMLQAKVNTGIKDTTLPVKKTFVSVEVPEINGTKPTKANAIAKHTKATTGEQTGLNFIEDNYTYDTENSVLKINKENTENQIAWLKNVQDEYIVTFIFEGKEVYDFAQENGIDTKITASASIEVYNAEQTVIEAPSVEMPLKRTDTLGTIADFQMAATSTLSKGQIYSNYDASSKKKETLYAMRYVATVSSRDLTNNICFTQSIDKFLNEDGEVGLTTVSGNHYTYNKNISIDVNVFNKILGEEGTIEVYKKDGTLVGTIDKDLEAQDGKYVLDISEDNINEMKIQTSKPIMEGEFDITVQKAVKTEIDYSKAQMKEFEKIEVGLNGEISGSTQDVTKQIDLKEPTSVAKLAISKTDLTTVVKNENVEIRATLDTSNSYNALYKNPTLKITLPSYISKVDIKNYDIVMANGLKIKSAPQVKTENGNQVIYITLEGTQAEYTIDAEYEGTIVILNTDLTTKTLTPTSSDKMTMEFTNANEMSTNNKGTAEATINFVAPAGVVAANGISNYVAGKDIMSISEKGMTGEIATYSPKQVATIYGKIINNYENAINNVVVLGRMPVKDNKEIDGETSLGSTFSTILKTGLTLKGIEEGKYTVYYSEKVDASQDLSNSENGWNNNPTTDTKSYMIVFAEDYEMKQGEMIEFSYDVEIPANLKHDNNVSEMYKVYYHNISSIGRMAEAKTSSVMTLTTGQGPELTIELKSTVGPTVYEGQIVKMKAVVTNTGSITAKNVKVTVPVPENAKFVKYVVANGFYNDTSATKVLDVGTIEPGKTKEVSYFIKIDTYIKVEDQNEGEGEDDHDHNLTLDEEDLNVVYEHDEEVEDGEIVTETPTTPLPKDISHMVSITADDLTGNISSNEYKFTIQKGSIAMEMISGTTEDTTLKKGDIIKYQIPLYNITGGTELTNTVVTIPLPNGIKYKSAKILDSMAAVTGTTEGITYDENTVTVNIGTLQIQKAIELEVEVEEFSGSISMMAKAIADGIPEQYSNIAEYEAEKLDIQIADLTATPKYVPEGEQITYNLKIKNNGKSIVYHVNVTDLLPTDVQFAYANYKYSGRTQSVTSLTNGKVDITINQIQPGETVEVNVVAVAKLLADKQDKQISNKMTVTVKGYDAEDTNTVTNIIEYNQKLHQDIENQDVTPTNPTVTRYKITGTAWLDSNQNGKRDDDETLLPNIPVMLLNKEDNSIVKDVDSGTQKKTSTGDNGEYEFTNLEKGEYIVTFLYDASQYSLTTYQEKDVDASLNSDAININITVDGVRTIAGTSDAIKIIDENIRDIDIGLYTSAKFDLKLDKYINKITRTTPTSGTTTYNYENSKIAKIEVLNQNLGKSNLVIEYKIVVTNEGAIAGYAKKIVDYLPEGVGFSTELNKDWYLSDNGNVYNASLANELIEPGESKELTLVVTKKFTEDSLGTLNNNAEIYESYNEQGLQDMDSTPGNKAQDEDDMSKADIILSLVTGTIIKYTAIILGVITILGFGIFIIKRNVLEKKNN